MEKFLCPGIMWKSVGFTIRIAHSESVLKSQMLIKAYIVEHKTVKTIEKIKEKTQTTA